MAIDTEELVDIGRRIDSADDSEIGGLYDEVVSMLNKDPDDYRLRYLFGAVSHRALHDGVAASVLEPMLRTHGNWGSLRMTYGLVLDAIGRHEDALAHYDAAARDKGMNKDSLCANRASALLKLGRYDDAHRVLVDGIGPREASTVHANMQINLAFAKVCVGDLGAGWDLYEAGLATQHRSKIDFGLPRWDGNPKARVLVYGEQGLGDEIMYASMLDDLRDKVEAVAVECDPRLSLLFKRSFPWATVVGSRNAKGPKDWVGEFAPTHQLACGSLTKHFRRDIKSFKENIKTAYLHPDLAYRDMYRALVKRTAGDRGKLPVIGIAWSGGGPKTKMAEREIPVAAFAPLVKRDDAIFVSLQYRKGAKEEIELSGLPIQHHEFATGMGASYDHTAGMIAACDRIIATDTTAIHAAGALGVRTDCLLTTPCMWVHPPWHGDHSAWYSSVRLHRKPQSMDWTRYIAHLVNQKIL